MTHVWSPDSTTIDGWMIETPIRSPTLPVNLWIHWAGISKDWGEMGEEQASGHWRDETALLIASVADGDTVLAGQGAVSLAGAHRQEAGFLNTDDWGMALNSVWPLPSPVVGPGAVTLFVEMSTLGKCWPAAVALTVDLLVLRPALIPQTPLPYGQRPKPRLGLSDRIKEREDIIAVLRSLSAQKKDLKARLKRLDREILAEPASPLSLPRRVSMGLSMSRAAPSGPTRQVAPPEQAAPDTPRPKTPRRRKS